MDVGAEMESLVERWSVKSGSRPRPENEDESMGALEGRPAVAGARARAGAVTAGL
jgi:hypothetical protein